MDRIRFCLSCKYCLLKNKKLKKVFLFSEPTKGILAISLLKDKFLYFPPGIHYNSVFEGKGPTKNSVIFHTMILGTNWGFVSIGNIPFWDGWDDEQE